MSALNNVHYGFENHIKCVYFQTALDKSMGVISRGLD